MQFRTPYDFSKGEFKTAVGDFKRPTYKAVLGKDGAIEVEQDGVELTYEKIQSYKDSVDINVIIKRFATGDTLALEQRSGVYGDFVSVPSSYMEVLNSIVEARNAYEMKKPNVSFDEFIKNALKPVSAPSEPIVEEVVSDEQKSE